MIVARGTITGPQSYRQFQSHSLAHTIKSFNEFWSIIFSYKSSSCPYHVFFLLYFNVLTGHSTYSIDLSRQSIKNIFMTAKLQLLGKNTYVHACIILTVHMYSKVFIQCNVFQTTTCIRILNYRKP